MKRIALICLIATSIAGSQFHSATATAAQPDLTDKKLPSGLDLTEEQTVLYDAPNGKEVGTSDSSFVQILDAEKDWREHLIEESDPSIWYKITIPGKQGEFWIKPKHPDFPDQFFEWIQTSGEEVLYDEPSSKGKTTSTISAQPLKYMGTYQGYYKIQTWLGYKWIKPKHKLVPYYIPTDEFVTLNATTPIFGAPESDAKVNGYLSAGQSVNAFERINYDWFHIRTWLGDQWINPSYSLPADLRTQDETIDLKGNTPVYEYPNRDAKVLGTLAPQELNAFESGSGWHHIHSSWLGDAWVYATDPNADPETYKPPVTVKSQPVSGEWGSLQYDSGSNWPRGFPLDPSIELKWTEQAEYLPYGKPVPLSFKLANASDDPITLKKTANITVEILRVTGSLYDRTWEPVWQGTLPELSYDYTKRMQIAELKFAWDGKDSDGKSAPFGEYLAVVKLPLTIPYIDAKGEEGSQEVATSIHTAFPFIIGAP